MCLSYNSVIVFKGNSYRPFKLYIRSPEHLSKSLVVAQRFFRLGRVTRHGCPLSPLIFVLAIEPLPIAMLQHPDISGYGKGSSTYKFCMYADDVLLFLTNPLTTLPNLLQTLSAFANMSGLLLNVSKSVALPVGFTPAEIEHLKNSFSFIWVRSSLPYLGINLSGDYNSLFENNFPPMISKLKHLLKSWSTFRISFLFKPTLTDSSGMISPRDSIEMYCIALLKGGVWVSLGYGCIIWLVDSHNRLNGILKTPESLGSDLNKI